METVTVAFPKLGIAEITMNPVAITVGGLEIRWYGIIILTGIIVATLFALRKLKLFSLTFDDILDLLIFSLPAAILGCRLYFCFFYEADYYIHHPLEIITGITDGGLAFYGGLIAAVLVGSVVMKVKKLNVLGTIDLALTVFPIAQAIGRWGNFVNGEAYGTETNLPWGMNVTNTEGFHPSVHPTFLYESLWNVIGFVILYKHINNRKFDGENALLYLLWYGFGRMFIEGLRTDSLFIPGTNIRVSQLLSVIMVVVAATLLFLIPIIKKKRAKNTNEENMLYVPIVDTVNELESFESIENASTESTDVVMTRETTPGQ